MIKLAHGLFIALICGLASPSYSESPEPRRVRPYGAFDVFLPGDVGNDVADGTRLLSSQLAGIGYNTSWRTETKSAIGFRGGVMTRMSDSVDIGLSVGYIMGPGSKSTVLATAPGLSGNLSYERDINFIRFLVEPTLNVPMGENSAFHLGTGLGLAQGKVEERYSCVGNACLSTAETRNSSTWSGFTWEFSPYFSYHKATFGARYAGFPKFGGNASNSKISWTTVAFFAGFKF